MSKNKTHKKILFSLTGFLVGALLTIGIGTLAYTGVSPKVIVEGDYIEAVEQIAAAVDDTMLGGLVHNVLESFDEGIAVDGTTIIDSSGNLTADATNATTTIPRLDFSIDVALDWNATSTDPHAALLAQFLNPGNDLICQPPVLDISTAVGAFGGNYRIATSTRSGDLSVHNTTSAALIGTTRIATTTSGILTPLVANDVTGLFIGADAIGNYYNQVADGDATMATGTAPFILKSGEILFAWTDYAGATSTDSWTNGAAAFAGVGSLKADCRNRY